MAQIIEIKIQNKIAKTDFNGIVSFNDVYRLKFDFDEEWEDYPQRVAVVYWEGGAAEVLFHENECDMPRINSHFSENVHVGVYSVVNGKRIASSLVPIRCLPGAYKAPPAKNVDSLHEQVLDELNKLGDPHKFVTVDTNQTVTGQKTFTENLMVGDLEAGIELNPSLGTIVKLTGRASNPIKLPDKMGTFALLDDLPDLSDLRKQSETALQPGDVTVAYTPMGERDRKTFRLTKGAQVEFHGFDSELIDDDFLSIEGTRLKAEGYTTFQSGDITLIGGQNIGIAQEGNKITFVGADIPDISGLAEKTQVQEVEFAAQNAQSTADSAKSAAQKAQSTADTANTAAQKAQSTAEKAQETADSANTAAGKAQSTADFAKTAAQTAQNAAKASLQPEDVTVVAEQDSGDLNLPLKKGTRIYLHGFSADLVSDNALSIDGTRLKAGTSQDPIGGDITLTGDETIHISQVGSEFVFSANLPENHVTTDTEQTITERKTFTEPLTVGDYDVNAIVIDSTGIQVCSDGTCSYLTLPKKFDTVATLGDIPTNHVTTDTKQEISGEKTFTGLGGLEVKDTEFGDTTNISSNRITIGYGNKEASMENPVDYLVISPSGFSINEDMGGMSGGGGRALSFPEKSGTLARKEDIPTNHVTTDTKQEISGEKTFSSGTITVGKTSETAVEIQAYGSNRSLRVYSSGSSYAISIPFKYGTMALLEDIPADKDIFLKAHPVGSYYISNNSTSPKDLFGGSWTAITGRFLYCNAGTGTGGSNEVTLSYSQMPNHDHHVYFYNPTYQNDVTYMSARSVRFHQTNDNEPVWSDGDQRYTTTLTGTTPSGDGQPHNNMPAYQEVYCWRRTA